MSDFEAEYHESLDKQKITEVLYRYCRGVDRGDEALLKNVFHPDATDDLGMWKGNGHEFASFIVGALAGVSTQHTITNILIDLQGDSAFCESYCMAIAEEPELKRTVHSRNADRFERRNGEWRIASRLVVFDAVRTTPQCERADMGPTATWGSRNKSDPIYHLGR